MAPPASALRPPWLAVAMISAAGLGYELLLTRLLSEIHWHHLVSVVISLALLGFGASGTFLTLFRNWLLARFVRAFTASALLFAITSVAGFYLARSIPLNPLDMAWNSRQLLYLAAVYLLLALPFFAVANCIGLALGRFPTRIDRLYATDLIGAGAGTGLLLLLLSLASPDQILLVLAITGAFAAVIGNLQASPGRPHLTVGSALLLTAALLLMPDHWRHAVPADYKDLHQALATRGAEVTRQLSNPLGTLTRVDNVDIPFRYAPGLSLVAPESPPPQSALFVNGDFHSVTQPPDGAREYLFHLSSALAWSLLDSPRVLLLGADQPAVLQALAMGAARLDITEENPLLAELLLSLPDIRGRTAETISEDSTGSMVLHLATNRGFTARTTASWDLIQLGGGPGQSAGLNARQENYRYTLEAFVSYLQRLTADGLISITRGLRLPPRDSLKLTATAIAALRQLGVSRPAQHLALIRSWNTTTLLISRSPLSDKQLRKIRDFSRQRLFDLSYLPDLKHRELNRYNQLQRPYFYLGVSALLERGDAFIHNYRFNIRPASDDRPYFHRFSRLGDIPELLHQPADSGLAHLDWGVLLLMATLLLALISSLLLILLPLWWRNVRGAPAASVAPVRILLYFSAIGLAFLFIEIASIQRFQLYLGQPVYAIAVVLGGFLVFAGAGSYLSGKLAAQQGLRRLALITGGLVLATFALFITQQPSLLGILAPLPFTVRVLACLLLIAPPAIAMGMPFPLGLQRLSRQAPELQPWAWGINGCASVVSAVLAPLLAMEIGYRGVLVLAGTLYLLACFSFPVASERQSH